MLFGRTCASYRGDARFGEEGGRVSRKSGESGQPAKVSSSVRSRRECGTTVRARSSGECGTSSRSLARRRAYGKKPLGRRPCAAQADVSSDVALWYGERVMRHIPAGAAEAARLAPARRGCSNVVGGAVTGTDSVNASTFRVRRRARRAQGPALRALGGSMPCAAAAARSVGGAARWERRGGCGSVRGGGVCAAALDAGVAAANLVLIGKATSDQLVEFVLHAPAGVRRNHRRAALHVAPRAPRVGRGERAAHHLVRAARRADAGRARVRDREQARHSSLLSSRSAS
jgi:hypothetical protein